MGGGNLVSNLIGDGFSIGFGDDAPCLSVGDGQVGGPIDLPSFASPDGSAGPWLKVAPLLDRERLTTLLTAFVKTPSILEKFSNVPMPWWHPVEYLVNDLRSKTLEQQIQLAKKKGNLLRSSSLLRSSAGWGDSGEPGVAN